ncbi:MAG: hypothetical protein WCQ66_01545 [Sphaerochaetaceae bacterium]|jgi:hypothetical protein
MIGEEDPDFLYVGNGMMDYESIPQEHTERMDNLTREPHYCSSCEIIFSKFIGEDPVVCPKCKNGEYVHSYNSKETCETEPPLTEYGDPDFSRGNYFRPRRKTFSLKFLEAGFWD